MSPAAEARSKSSQCTGKGEGEGRWRWRTIIEGLDVFADRLRIEVFLVGDPVVDRGRALVAPATAWPVALLLPGMRPVGAMRHAGRRRRRRGGALGASGAPRPVALLLPGVSLERAMRHTGRRRRRRGGALGASGAPRPVTLLLPGVSLERAMRHTGRRRRRGGALRATAATGPAAPDLPFVRVEGAVLAAGFCGYLRRED